MLLLSLLARTAHGYAAWLPCYVDLDESEVVMNHYIVPSDKATNKVLQLQVRPQGTEEWLMTTTTTTASESSSAPLSFVSVQPDTVYEARFFLDSANGDLPENVGALEFVMELSDGGSFAVDKTGHCEASSRAHGKGQRIVNFTVNGTGTAAQQQDVTLLGAWATGHSTVYLTPAVILRLDDKSRFANGGGGGGSDVDGPQEPEF